MLSVFGLAGLFDLACGDPLYLDRVADAIGRALLTAWTFKRKLCAKHTRLAVTEIEAGFADHGYAIEAIVVLLW